MFNVQCSMFDVSKPRQSESFPGASAASGSVTSHIAHRTSHMGFRGFTLTELLVVIGIIALLMTVGLPSIKAMFASSTLDAAYTLVSSSVSAARTYGPRKPLVGPELDLTGMGAAAVFIRNTDGQIEIHITQHRSYDDAAIPSPVKAIYRDVLEPIVLGENVGIVGISQGGSNTELIAPPVRATTTPFAPSSPYAFVIRFDTNGVLIARKSTSVGTGISEQRVFYNINASTVTASDNHAMDGCVGVVVFDAKAYKDQFGSDASGTISYNASSTSPYGWIMNNGTPMLFNRYTGAVMKEQ